MSLNVVDADIVIIGSGAGGGTVAQALGGLARAGKRVLLIEKGPRLRTEQFDGRELAMANLLYANGGGFPVADGTVTLAFAEALGGSTQVYTGTSLVPPERVIDRWNLPGLDHDDLRARIDRFKGQNSVALLPEHLLNDNNRLFAEGCRKLGWHPEQFPINVKGCKGSSLCNLGCPNGAKQGTAQVQLPRAAADGVEVVTRARAVRLTPAVDGGAVEVVVDDGPHPSGASSEWPAGNYLVRAKTIVCAAGAIRGPALLLRSGLGGELPATGRWWTCHPAHILAGEHDRAITNSVGHPKAFLWDERIVEDRYFLEACMYFPFVTAKNLTGFGPDHERLMRAYERLQMILVLACDEALPEHRITVDDDGEPTVHYKLTPATIQAMVKATRAAARIFFAAGAQAVHAPSARPTLLTAADLDRLDERVHERHFKPGTVSVSAAHLMGGCRMGTDPRTSVTTARGQVHGYPWLYVADASLFPTALEINPYMTVMALAERVAEAVAERAGGDIVRAAA